MTQSRSGGGRRKPDIGSQLARGRPPGGFSGIKGQTPSTEETPVPRYLGNSIAQWIRVLSFPFYAFRQWEQRNG